MSEEDLLPTALDATAENLSAGAVSDLNRVLEGVLQISEFVGSVMLLDDILDRIVTITCEVLNATVSSIYLIDENDQLILRSNRGFEPELRGHVTFQMGEGIVGWVAVHNELVALADAAKDARYRPLPTSLELNCRAYLCAPLRIQQQVIGVMTLRKTTEYAFTQSEILFFVAVCKQVAIVIEKARMYEKKLEAERLAAVALSLTGVAHYIKNVLQTMRGGEYLVEQGILKQDMQFLGEGWEVLKRASQKIRGLVENILNYCRESQPQRQKIDLNAMVQEMVGSLLRHAQERGVALFQELDPKLENVWIDPDQMFDAVLNLVTNAIDACPEHQDGQVTVRTVQLSGRHQVLIEIVDNGTGIPEEIQDKIFNLFFSTKGQKGTGIGLAATKKIVEEHGGAIELESTVGQGSRFRLFFSSLEPDASAS